MPGDVSSQILVPIDIEAVDGAVIASRQRHGRDSSADCRGAASGPSNPPVELYDIPARPVAPDRAHGPARARHHDAVVDPGDLARPGARTHNRRCPAGRSGWPRNRRRWARRSLPSAGSRRPRNRRGRPRCRP